MVTTDRTIKNVGDFNGDLKTGRRDYERAKQGSDFIEQEMSKLEQTLKAQTGFDNFNLPAQKTTAEVDRGDVSFTVKSETRTKRPAYKTAVTEMENYLTGIGFLVAEGRAITGVAREGNQMYIAADKLLEAYDIIVAGVMKPEVKQTIRYKTSGDLKDEKTLDEMTVPENRGGLNEENSANYVRMDRIKPDLDKFVKDYDAELVKGQKQKEKMTAVNTRSGYKTTKSTAKGTDWAYVVKSMVTTPTEPELTGELNYLADDSISKAEKQREMPEYTIMNREVRGTKQLYVSMNSVYDRIQELKGDQSVVAKRLNVQLQEVV